MIDLYVFASHSLTNIWAGIGAGVWAVSQRDEVQMKGLRTKAAKMTVGSVGVLYCSEIASLTTPFIVYSPVDPDGVVEDVWPERWVLPFRIHPLGTPRRRLHRAEAMSKLDVLRASGRTNISQILHLPATTVFSPNAVPPSDWAVLLHELAE